MERSFMLTVIRADGSARDVQVDNAASILEAITAAESFTGCRVDHGRGGVGSDWHPAVTIDAKTNSVLTHHDRPATESMRIATPNAHRLFE